MVPRSVQSGTPLYAFPRESSGSWNPWFSLRFCMDCLKIFAGWYHLRPRMPGSHVFAPRCGRAIFCATMCLLQNVVAQFFARPHVCHQVLPMTHMWSRNFLRDRILEQACGRAKNCATIPMTYRRSRNFLRARILEQARESRNFCCNTNGYVTYNAENLGIP